MNVINDSTPLKSKKRIFYFDVLRAFAIMAVILCHVSTMYGGNSSFPSSSIPVFLFEIGITGVPLFFMLSGALLLNRNYDLCSFLKKRFSRIFIPFIFWLIILLFFGIILFNWNGSEIFKEIIGAGSHTWFIWVMVGIYLITPVINSFIKDYKFKGIKYFLVIWLITIILKTLNLYPFEQLELSYFAGYVGYFVLGYYLTNAKFKLNSKILMLLGMILFVLFLIIGTFLKYCGLQTFTGNYLNIFILLESVGLFLFFRGLSDTYENNNIYNKIKNGTVGKLILSLSVCSYGIYLIHIIIRMPFKIIKLPLKFLPLIFIVILVVSWLIIYIFSKIPYLEIVSGTK